MGRKPIEEKRSQFNRYVAGATAPLVKSLSEQLGISEGAVIDRAVQMLAIAESFGVESISKSVGQDVPEGFDVETERERALPDPIGTRFTPLSRFLRRRT